MNELSMTKQISGQSTATSIRVVTTHIVYIAEKSILSINIIPASACLNIAHMSMTSASESRVIIYALTALIAKGLNLTPLFLNYLANYEIEYITMFLGTKRSPSEM